mmetsp:Transcript_49438/g.98482  ORF Transcript_49438/g.98482 Transcript_49438/m.98482 type:complete len:247 (-) Transcript_49438:44-784(-)
MVSTSRRPHTAGALPARSTHTSAGASSTDFSIRNEGLNTMALLTRFPDNWLSIVRVDISGNNLGPQLPTAFFVRLPSVTALSSAHCCLTSFPSLTCASRLVRLELGHNQLTSASVPRTLSYPSLQWLDLGHNQLTNLPAGLGCLKALLSLQLSSNALRTLAPCLGAEEEAEATISTDTAITTYSSTAVVSVHRHSMPCWPALTSLDLSDNPSLRSLPAALGDLRRLTSLSHAGKGLLACTTRMQHA